MAECNHVFIGRADGVHCNKCGLHMSITEYSDYMGSKTTGENKAKPKRQTRKKVKTDE